MAYAELWSKTSGLSGIFKVNNFTTVNALQTGPSPGSIWELENSIFQGPATGGFQLLDSARYFDNVYDAVNGKKNAGFNTSVTDYWLVLFDMKLRSFTHLYRGRALSFQLVNASEGGPSYTWSSIALFDDFANGKIPMPLVVADGRAPGETLISGNTTVYVGVFQ